MKGFDAIRYWGVRAFLIGVFNELTTKIRLYRGITHSIFRINEKQMILSNKDPGICRTLILFGERELDHKQLLVDFCTKANLIFDLGANIGYYVLLEKTISKSDSLRIIAIEPSPENISLLRCNVELNNLKETVLIEQCGVSEENGVKPFFLSSSCNLNTFERIGSASRSLTGKVIDVKIRSVYDLAKEFGEPDLIRMDIEGHEVAVLNGIANDASGFTKLPDIIFETHFNCYNKENDIKNALYRLRKLNYRVIAASSSSSKGTNIFRSLNYLPYKTLKSDGHKRSLFKDIDFDHLIYLMTVTGGIRTVLLSQK